jgi:hypothetical protein
MLVPLLLQTFVFLKATMEVEVAKAAEPVQVAGSAKAGYTPVDLVVALVYLVQVLLEFLFRVSARQSKLMELLRLRLPQRAPLL